MSHDNKCKQEPPRLINQVFHLSFGALNRQPRVAALPTLAPAPFHPHEHALVSHSLDGAAASHCLQFLFGYLKEKTRNPASQQTIRATNGDTAVP